MIVRPATSDDVPAVADIVERAYRLYVDRIGRRPGPMDVDYDARMGEADVFVAAAGDRVTGVIVLEREVDHVLIENVAVDPDRQGTGVGRLLLAHAERFARDCGVEMVRLYTNVAMVENQRLYTRLGYTLVGTTHDTPRGYRQYVYQKRLAPG